MKMLSLLKKTKDMHFIIDKNQIKKKEYRI